MNDIFANLEIVEDGQHHVPDPAVLTVAREVAKWWAVLYGQAVGKPYRPSERHAIHFYKAAALIIRTGDEPAGFVRTRLDGMLLIGKPFVTALWTDKIVSPDHNQLGVRTACIYRANIALFTELSSIFEPKQILRDPAVELSPLFRVVMARELGLTDVVDHYREEATVELAVRGASAREIFGEVSFL